MLPSKEEALILVDLHKRNYKSINHIVHYFENKIMNAIESGNSFCKIYFSEKSLLLVDNDFRLFSEENIIKAMNNFNVKYKQHYIITEHKEQDNLFYEIKISGNF